MRKIRHVEANLAVSDGRGLPDPLCAGCDRSAALICHLSVAL
jgi:hypothetical protein